MPNAAKRLVCTWRRSESCAIYERGLVPTTSRRAWNRTGLSLGMNGLFDAYAAEV